MSRSGNSSKTYSDIRAGGRARTQLGDTYTYITNNNHYTEHPEQWHERSGKGRRELEGLERIERERQEREEKEEEERERQELERKEREQSEVREQIERERTERNWRTALHSWLVFAEIDDRREQVPKAQRDTFRWMFEPGHTTGFVEWLQNGDGIFWISGKPASGKSTLMKFITRESSSYLRSSLQVWTGKTPLVIASFWFWAAGSQLQRSLVGLYRTLLLQMLKTDENLCRTAFPEWEVKFSMTEPTMEMLISAMNNILEKDVLAHNFFFVIDGLDEYGRDSIGKRELVELMTTMSQSSRVKLLLSSRPELPFEAGFRYYPSLRLEDLTRTDILNYIQAKLWDNPSVRDISEAEKVGIEDIAAFVRENARGVFLWVTLMINITLDGIDSFDNMLGIRDRIMKLPVELDGLFTHILTERIQKRHKLEAFRYLLLALAWESSRPGVSLCSVVLAMAQHASTRENVCAVAASSQLQIEDAIANFPSRLRSRCQGLLECSDKTDERRSVVTIMHRTLLDYLQEEAGAKDLLISTLGEGFEYHTAIMAGLVCFEGMYVNSIRSNWQDRSKHIATFFHFNVLAESSACRHTTELIAILRRTMAKSPWKSSDLQSGFTGMTVNSEKASAEDTPAGCSMLMLAYSIHTGGLLWLRESLAGSMNLDRGTIVSLLYYAVPPIRHNITNVTVNFQAAHLLLEHGADPTSKFSGVSVWGNAMNWLRADTEMVSKILKLMIQAARHAPDREKLRTVEALHGHESEALASQEIRQLVLERRCCFGSPVAKCTCAKAEERKTMALELLELIETSKSSKRRGRWKRLFARP